MNDWGCTDILKYFLKDKEKSKDFSNLDKIIFLSSVQNVFQLISSASLPEKKQTPLPSIIAKADSSFSGWKSKFYLAAYRSSDKCSGLPRTVVLCACYVGVTINSASFLSQKYAYLNDNLYGLLIIGHHHAELKKKDSSGG